jgi:hypothetical protein
MSEFNFKKGGVDNLFFGDLYPALAAITMDAQWTDETYKANLIAARDKLIEKHGKSHFAGRVSLVAFDVVMEVLKPNTIAVEMEGDGPTPFDDDETGEGTMNAHFKEQMKAEQVGL